MKLNKSVLLIAMFCIIVLIGTQSISPVLATSSVPLSPASGAIVSSGPGIATRTNPGTITADDIIDPQVVLLDNNVSDIVPTTLTVTPIDFFYAYYTDFTATLSPAVSGKTISFTLNGEAACSGLTNAGGLATCAAPLLVNVGSYPNGVVATFAGDLEYGGSTGSANLTIGKRPASVTPNPASKVYGDPDPVLTGTLDNFINPDEISATYSRTPGENVAGSPYTISATLIDPHNKLGNYEITYNTASFTITKKPASVTANAKSKTYGDDNPALTATVVGQVVGGDIINYSLSTTAAKYSNVGSYPIVVTLGSNPNYNVSKADSTLTINQKVATVTANAKTKYYGDDNPALTATVVGQVVGGDVINYSLSTTAAKYSNVGSYPIVVTLGSNPNYNVSKTDNTLTINQKAATVVANAKSKNYGDDNPALTATVVGQVEGGDIINYSLSTTAAKYSNVGSYPIVVTLGSNPNYDVSKADGTLTINQKFAAVTAISKSKTYGDDNPALTATVVGQVEGGDIINYSLSTTAAKYSNVGSYPIVVTLGSNPNYDVSKTDGLLTINTRPITVKADDMTKAVGQRDPIFTYDIISGMLVNGDTFTGTLTRDPGEMVGTYNIKPGTLAINSNYSLTIIGATFTITKAYLFLPMISR